MYQHNFYATFLQRPAINIHWFYQYGINGAKADQFNIQQQIPP